MPVTAAAPHRPSLAPLPNYPPPEHLFYVGAAAAAPRSIPWNCDDWQESPAVADADDARVSTILESLAANRGKSIYCAIDQSDTWTKSETWAAGRDRNERDDTVYFGQSGNFRGFLSAQEGYLTDGESGVTGVSRDLIFEFPREERKRRRIRYRNFELCPDNSYSNPAQRNPPYSPCVLQTGLHSTAGAVNSNHETAQDNAVDQWDTDLTGRPEAVDTAEKYAAWLAVSARQADANAQAAAGCRAAGARLRGSARILTSSSDETQGFALPYFGENQGSGGNYQFQSGRQIWFEATCKKRR